MTTLYHPRPARWLQFSLRTFFVLLTILGVVLGWMIHKARQQGIALAALKEMGCSFVYGDPDVASSTSTLEWLRKLLGENEFRNVTGLVGESSQMTDAGLVHLQGLTQLKSLFLNGTRVSDAGLVHLQGLTQLESLDLSRTRVSNAGLVRLQGLSRLVALYFAGTRVSDAGVQQLRKALPNCKIDWQP